MGVEYPLKDASVSKSRSYQIKYLFLFVCIKRAKTNLSGVVG